ncbi:MAG: hypothetical protein AAGA86_00705 [Bacteroidota bacterium]
METAEIENQESVANGDGEALENRENVGNGEDDDRTDSPADPSKTAKEANFHELTL